MKVEIIASVFSEKSVQKKVNNFIDYLNNVTGSYSNARLKITGGSNNSGTTRVKGYCCPD